VKPCVTVEDGVRAIMEVYEFTPTQAWEYIPRKEGQFCDTLLLDGKAYPLLFWRCDTQVVQMYDFAPEREPVSMKTSQTARKTESLQNLLYRELDVCEHILRTKVKSIMAFRNGGAMNLMATMENECVCVLELCNVLNEKSQEQGRRIFWGKKGMASDGVVSQKVKNASVYLFTEDEEKPETFNDIFQYTYGLGREDVLRACMISEILMGMRDVSHWNETNSHLQACLQAAERSAATMERVFLQEAEA